MKEKKKTLEELVQEALKNVQEDREKILAAYDKMKTALDSANQEESVMLGNTAVKVLEQLTKANEQIVRLAQIKEREETKKSESKKNNRPLDIDALVSAFEEKDKDSDDNN